MYRSLSAALALGLLAAGPALAQPNTSAAVTATLTVPTILHIEVSSAAVNFLADDAAFTAGFADGDQATSVTHRGNVQHTVSVAADAALFTPSGGGPAPDGPRADKPATDLTYSVDGGGFTAMSTTAAAVHSGAPRGAHVNDEDVTYRVALNIDDDTPGVYTLGLTYTVAAD